MDGPVTHAPANLFNTCTRPTKCPDAELGGVATSKPDANDARSGMPLWSEIRIGPLSTVLGGGCPRPRRRWDCCLFQSISVVCERWDYTHVPRDKRELDHTALLA